MDSKKKILSMLSVAVGQSLWGISYLFTRVALQYASVETLLSLRFLTALSVILLLTVFRRTSISLRKGSRQNKIYLLIFTILQPLYYMLESKGILYTNSAFAGVMLSLTPVVAIAIGSFFFHEKTPRMQAVLCLLPIAGVIIITLSGSQIGAVQPMGVLFLLGTCVAAALLTVCNKKAVIYTPLERTFVTVLAGSAVYTPLSLHGAHWDFSVYLQPLKTPVFILCLLALVFACSLGANTLVNAGAGALSVAQFSIFSSLTTVVSMAAGVCILHEPLTAASLIGAILIIVGIILVAVFQNFDARKPRRN